MASEEDRRVAFATLKFLEQQRQAFELSGSSDNVDSLRVAQECLFRVYGIKHSHLDDNTCPLQTSVSLKDTFLNASSVDDAERQTRVAEAKALAVTKKEEGNKHVKEGNYQQAVDAYTEAIALHSDATFFCNRAAAHTYLKNYEDALEDCDSAIDLNPGYAKAYVRRGMVLSLLDRLDEAEGAYQQAVRLEPDNANYKTQLNDIRKRAAEAAGTQSNVGSGSGGAGVSSGMAPGAGTGGMPDLGSLLNNPMMINAARNIMQDENMRDRFGQMASQLFGGAGGAQGGGAPDLSGLLSGLMGGANAQGGSGGGDQGDDDDDDDDDDVEDTYQ